MKKTNVPSVEKRIQDFNELRDPLYIVDLEDGSYSLGYPMCLAKKRIDFGQAAFDAYAKAEWDIGVNQHGNGYDWEDVFRKCFENDPRINKLYFCSEKEGFFCDCKDLDVLLDMGTHFYRTVLRLEKFVPMVFAGLDEGKKRRFKMKTEIPQEESMTEGLKQKL